MRILPLSQSFQAKKINLKDYAIFEEPILTNEKIISPEDTKEFNYKMQKVLAEYKQKALGLWRMPKMYLLNNNEAEPERFRPFYYSGIMIPFI